MFKRLILFIYLLVRKIGDKEIKFILKPFKILSFLFESYFNL